MIRCVNKQRTHAAVEPQTHQAQLPGATLQRRHHKRHVHAGRKQKSAGILSWCKTERAQLHSTPVPYAHTHAAKRTWLWQASHHVPQHAMHYAPPAGMHMARAAAACCNQP